MWLIPTTVIKVGGSLLDWPGLSTCLDQAIDDHHRSRLALVVGGGGAADWIRLMHRTHGLSEHAAHALALQAMDLNAAILHSLRPHLPLVASTSSLRKIWADRPTPVIIQAQTWLREDENTFRSDPLPRNWDTTSDSIAARIAARIGADTLILWKSRPIHSDTPLSQAVLSGLVDPTFPQAARHLKRILYVAIRADSESPRELWQDEASG
jgi:aspartokinase-like uncharacterized kinase